MLIPSRLLNKIFIDSIVLYDITYENNNKEY